MNETKHLLSTSANTKRLMQAIAEDKAGKVRVKAPDAMRPTEREKRGCSKRNE